MVDASSCFYCRAHFVLTRSIRTSHFASVWRILSRVSFQTSPATLLCLRFRRCRSHVRCQHLPHSRRSFAFDKVLLIDSEQAFVDCIVKAFSGLLIIWQWRILTTVGIIAFSGWRFLMRYFVMWLTFLLLGSACFWAAFYP